MHPRGLASAARALLAAAAAVAAPAAALVPDPAPASGGALRLTADPPRLVLGRDGAAEVRVSGGTEAEEIEVTTNAGRIEEVRRSPGGGFTFRYRPPADHWPRVALVSALARGTGDDGWLAIPLSGQGDARVHARPGAEITLRIGDREFGPRRAGADGLAVIPVIVPPGVREAHHGFHPVDLHVPETNLVHAMADRAVVRADQGGALRVFAYVVAPHGAARPGDTPVFEPTRGDVSVAGREPGAYVGTWLLPPGPAGEERLVVRLPGAAASRAELRAEVIAGPPATVAVSFDRAAMVAGETDEVGVTARVLDGAGNPTRAEIDLSSDTGAVDLPAERAPGLFQSRLRVPARFGGRREALVIARVRDAGIAGSRALKLAPGPPAVARFDDPGPVVLADGSRTAALRLTVLDRYQNPVPRPAPAFSTAQGRVVAVASEQPGVYLVRYQPPPVDRRTEALVVAELDGLRARADLVLVPPARGLTAAPDLGAAADLRGRFVAPRMGVALELPTPIAAGPQPAIWARFELSALAFATEASGTAGAPGTSTRHGVTTFLAGAGTRFEVARDLQAWASAAAGAALARSDAPGAAPAWGAAPAGRLVAGAGWRRGWGLPFVELGLLAAGRTTGSLGEFACVTLGVGVRFETDLFGRGASAGENGSGDVDPAHRG
ncbi:MAG TPA: hypothetical protein VLU43_09590 [Anaeromyxobacteraceae bacterium]|nr:hypothetical protein [Anaeromyxobacteraceae bacterium]